MPLRKRIQQLRAVCLLVLLVLGNTPRQWLHDYFATHSGCAVLVTNKSADKDCIQTDQLHCRQIDLVIVSPFLEPLVTPFAAPTTIFAEPVAGLYASIPSRYSCRSGLRGPPSLPENNC